MRFLLNNSDFQKLKEAHYSLMREYAYVLSYVSKLPFFVNSTANEYLNKENDISLKLFFFNLQSSRFLTRFKSHIDFAFLNFSTLLAQKSLIKFFVEYHIHSKIAQIKNIYILMEASINDEEELVCDSRNQKYWLRQATRECERFNNTSKPINNIYPILISSFPFLGFVAIVASLIPSLLSQLIKIYNFNPLAPLSWVFNIKTLSGVTNIFWVLFLLGCSTFFITIVISKSFSYKRSLFITNFKNRHIINSITTKEVLIESFFRTQDELMLLKIKKMLSIDMKDTIYKRENQLFSILQEKKSKEFTIDLLADAIMFIFIFIFWILSIFFFIVGTVFILFFDESKLNYLDLLQYLLYILLGICYSRDSFKLIGQSILRGKNRANKKILT